MTPAIRLVVAIAFEKFRAIMSRYDIIRLKPTICRLSSLMNLPPLKNRNMAIMNGRRSPPKIQRFCLEVSSHSIWV